MPHHRKVETPTKRLKRQYNGGRRNIQEKPIRYSRRVIAALKSVLSSSEPDEYHGNLRHKRRPEITDNEVDTQENDYEYGIRNRFVKGKTETVHATKRHDTDEQDDSTYHYGTRNRHAKGRNESANGTSRYYRDDEDDSDYQYESRNCHANGRNENTKDVSRISKMVKDALNTSGDDVPPKRRSQRTIVRQTMNMRKAIGDTGNDKTHGSLFKETRSGHIWEGKRYINHATFDESSADYEYGTRSIRTSARKKKNCDENQRKPTLRSKSEQRRFYDLRRLSRRSHSCGKQDYDSHDEDGSEIDERTTEESSRSPSEMRSMRNKRDRGNIKDMVYGIRKKPGPSFMRSSKQNLKDTGGESSDFELQNKSFDEYQNPGRNNQPYQTKRRGIREKSSDNYDGTLVKKYQQVDDKYNIEDSDIISVKSRQRNTKWESVKYGKSDRNITYREVVRNDQEIIQDDHADMIEDRKVNYNQIKSELTGDSEVTGHKLRSDQKKYSDRNKGRQLRDNEGQIQDEKVFFKETNFGLLINKYNELPRSKIESHKLKGPGRPFTTVAGRHTEAAKQKESCEYKSRNGREYVNNVFQETHATRNLKTEQTRDTVAGATNTENTSNERDGNAFKKHSTENPQGKIKVYGKNNDIKLIQKPRKDQKISREIIRKLQNVLSSEESVLSIEDSVAEFQLIKKDAFGIIDQTKKNLFKNKSNFERHHSFVDNGDDYDDENTNNEMSIDFLTKANRKLDDRHRNITKMPIASVKIRPNGNGPENDTEIHLETLTLDESHSNKVSNRPSNKSDEFETNKTKNDFMSRSLSKNYLGRTGSDVITGPNFTTPHHAFWAPNPIHPRKLDDIRKIDPKDKFADVPHNLDAHGKKEEENVGKTDNKSALLEINHRSAKDFGIKSESKKTQGITNVNDCTITPVTEAAFSFNKDEVIQCLNADKQLLMSNEVGKKVSFCKNYA